MAKPTHFTRQEPFSVGLRSMIPLSVAIIALLTLISLIVNGGYASPNISAATADATQPAATSSPQADSGAPLRQLRATEQSRLTTYGWVDRKNGVVHIPIDRAMELLLQRGLPARLSSKQKGEVF